MDVPDRERWKLLSPLLDELLDLDAPARATRLAQLSADDPALADELEALLGAADRAEAANFLDGVAEIDVEATLAGTRIGAYVIDAPLGQGGTGSVWRARRADGRFEGAVAVKLLHLSLVGRAGALRFEREGAILARLAHPHIARLLDAGVTPGGQPYLVLELVAGERIDRHCDNKRLNIEQRLALYADVLAAVAHAHNHLVIHRDIKPNNILVSDDGQVKLLDFGIAKLLQDEAAQITGEGQRALTPEYAAPEQLQGLAVTTATDVYALGVLLYQLLAGRHPTAPDTASSAEMMRATLATDPLSLATALTPASRADITQPERVAADRDTPLPRLRRQLKGDLENIVAQALRKDPAERYQTVGALAEDLRRYRAHEPVSARPDSLSYRGAKFVSRHRGLVAAGMLTFAAISAGIVGTFSQARRAELQSERATREAVTARQERDSAQQQQRLLRGTNEFLTLLMRDAAGGDPGAIRRQLDRASVLLERTKFEHPIVKIALLRQTAGRYAEIGDVGSGLKLMRQAIASLEGTDLGAPTSAVPVNLACSLARYLEDMDEPEQALAELDRADALIAAGAELTLPSRMECRMIRSFVESSLGHLDAGVEIAQDALRRLEASGVRDGEQHRVLRSAVSRALMLAGRPREALAIAAPLLEQSVAGQGRESMAVLRRSSIVTSIKRLGGQPIEALPLAQADHAAAARLVGEDHGDAGIDLELGRVLLALGRDAEAGRVLARAAATAREGANLGLVLAAELGAVEAALGEGRSAQAQALWAASEPRRQGALQRGGPGAIEVRRVEALLAAVRGDAAAAQHALAQARAAIDAAGGDAHPAAHTIAVAQGRHLLAAGDLAAALAEAERAVNVAARISLDPRRSSHLGEALLLRARVHAAAGRGDSARADAAAAFEQLQATLGAEHPATREAQRLMR